MGFRSLTRPIGPRGAHPRSRFGAWRARVSDRIARSSRFFLLGVVVACGIEVLVDWNQTLMEINVLRSTIRLKGENYVGILGKAADDELAAKDAAGLERLTHGIFDDEDAIYVRFTDANGAVVWDRLKADLPPALAGTGSGSFTQRYAHMMARDAHLALADPAGLAARVANSRYKDFAQAWTDATAKVVAAIAPPKPTGPRHGVVVYQDRLRDENHEKDDTISYAVGTVLGEDGNDLGTVLVAFDMARTNAAVRMKYLKFAGICSFFVALILVQNIVSRRNRLRLLDLEATYATAKRALRDAMPGADVRSGDLVASGSVDQASGPIDGMVWCAADEGGSVLVMVVDPDGEGIDAASVGLHVVRRFMERRHAGARPSLDEELAALGLAAGEIPRTRPLGALLLRVDAGTGAYEALGGSLAHLRVVGGAAPESPVLRASDEALPEGIVGPLRRASGVLGPGASVVAICADAARLDEAAFADGVARYVARTHEPGVAVPTQDAAIWTRGRAAALAERDIGVVAVSRAPG